MRRSATFSALAGALVSTVLGLNASAQTPFGAETLARAPFGAETLAWKQVGGTRIERGLAGLATGPVSAVWYGPGGSTLLAQTPEGRVFETSDFEHWRLSASGALPPQAAVAGRRAYRITADNIFVSEDGGRAWLNLTGFNNKSVIGGGFTSLAVSPRNEQDVVASNRYGVWRSLDGGMTWVGLNAELPALPVRRLTDRRAIVLDDSSALALTRGVWEAVTKAETAAAPEPLVARVPVKPERVWTDAARPDVALAIAGTKLYRTVNGGLFWDDVTGALPSALIHGVTAEREAGVVYLATDRGVYGARLSLDDAGPASPEWISISRELPAAAAWDVMLGADGVLTVALDGYGVYESPAPHKSRAIRLVSGADLTERAAAPGSLISVLGAKVTGISGGYRLLAASDRSSQLQVPFDARSGRATLSFDTAAGPWSSPLTIKEAAPAIFVDAEGAPLILDASSGLVLDSDIAVRAGASIQVLVTGLGKVSPDWPAGVPAPPDSPPEVVVPVTAFLDGNPVKVSRATLAPGYVGYYVVELTIPAIVNRGAADLRLVMNGEESNRVKLFLEPDRLQ